VKSDDPNAAGQIPDFHDLGAGGTLTNRADRLIV
jgi:hypothetical protein